jgi:predicted permease
MSKGLLYFLAGNRAGSSLEVQPDLAVLAFTAALSLLTGLLFGSIPSWQAARAGLLGQIPRSFRSRNRLRSVLVAAQIALSLVLLVGAGLFGRTLLNLRTADLGFRPENMVLLTLNPSRSGYKPADSDALFQTLLRRTESLPGVRAAALSDISPLSGGMFAANITVPGRASLGEREPNNVFIHASPGYLRTLGTPLLLGREFAERDRKGTPPVAIVNERFVAYYWPGQSPIGRHFKWGGDIDVEIVGLAKNAKYQEMREEPQITIYIPLAQRPKEELTLEVRTTGARTDTIPQLRQLVRSLDPNLPVYDVRTLDAQVDQALATERLMAALSTFFSGAATFLAAIGLYGSMAYAVARRRREIGIRMAVGARGRDVLKLFLGESLVIVTAGIACGLALAYAGSRLLRSLLYGLQPDDSATLLAAAAVLFLVGAAAAMIPARRASRTDPSVALRYEA